MGDCNKRNKSDEEESTCVCFICWLWVRVCFLFFYWENSFRDYIQQQHSFQRSFAKKGGTNISAKLHLQNKWFLLHDHTLLHIHTLTRTLLYIYTLLHIHPHTHTHSYNKHILLGTLKIQPSRLFVAYTKVKATCCQSWARFDNA